MQAVSHQHSAPRERVEELLGQLTLEEKVALLAGAEINASLGRQVDPGVKDRSPSRVAFEGQGDEGRSPKEAAS